MKSFIFYYCPGFSLTLLLNNNMFLFWIHSWMWAVYYQHSLEMSWRKQLCLSWKKKGLLRRLQLIQFVQWRWLHMSFLGSLLWVSQQLLNCETAYSQYFDWNVKKHIFVLWTNNIHIRLYWVESSRIETFISQCFVLNIENRSNFLNKNWRKPMKNL